MSFERDQVLECVSPTPGLIAGALYVCDGMVRVGLFEMVRVTAVHDGERGEDPADFADDDPANYAEESCDDIPF